MRYLKLALIGLPIIYLIACLSLLGVDSSIFKPPPSRFDLESEHLIEIKSSANSFISSYYRPAQTDTSPIILWSHGNAGDIRSIQALADTFYGKGYGFLTYDYPGYGLSPGKPSEEGCYQAIEVAYQYLTETAGIDPQRIIIAGQSLGSGPSCHLASQVPHRGLLLISPFLSIYRIVLPFPLFPGDRFQNVKRISKITTPLLIIHGTQDRLISFDHAEKLFDESSSSQKDIVPIKEGNHNNLFSEHGEEIFTAIESFSRL